MRTIFNTNFGGSGSEPGQGIATGYMRGSANMIAAPHSGSPRDIRKVYTAIGIVPSLPAVVEASKPVTRVSEMAKKMRSYRPMRTPRVTNLPSIIRERARRIIPTLPVFR